MVPASRLKGYVFPDAGSSPAAVPFPVELFGDASTIQRRPLVLVRGSADELLRPFAGVAQGEGGEDLADAVADGRACQMVCVQDQLELKECM